jgi:CheY-like chemotaxis protein
MVKEVKVILLVEDNEDDAFFFSRAIGRARIGSRLQHAEDGQAAIDYLSGREGYSNRDRFPLPDLIVLDLKLPKRSGFEVLAWIRENLITSDPPIIVSVLSSLFGEEDLSRADLLGSHYYAVKPPTGALFQTLAEKFNLTWPPYTGPAGWGVIGPLRREPN